MKHTASSTPNTHRSTGRFSSKPSRRLAAAGLIGLSVLLPFREVAAQATQIAAGRALLAEQKAESLAKAHEQFKTALNADPGNAEANLLRAATLLGMEFSTPAFRSAVEDPGIKILDPSPYSFAYELPAENKGIPVPRSGSQTSVQLGYLVSKKTLLDEIQGHLAKITDPDFSTQLTAAETSLLDVRIDYADVCFLRALVLGAKAAITMSEAYDLNEQYVDIAAILANRSQTLHDVFLAHPKWGTFSGNPGARAAARGLLLLAHAEWEKGLAAAKARPDGIIGHFADSDKSSSGGIIPPSRYLPKRPAAESKNSLASTPPATPNLFAIGDREQAQAFADTLKKLAVSLTTQTEATVDFLPKSPYDFLRKPRVHPSPLFTMPTAPRNYLPTRFDRGFFAPNAWPDPTFGGILPGSGADAANDFATWSRGLQTTIYEPYDFRILVGDPRREGYVDADGTTPLFENIEGISVDKDGNIFVADSGNRVIRKITTDNRIYTVAGLQTTGYNSWSYRQPASLSVRGAITTASDGSVYFANGDKISKLSPTGTLSILAGPQQYSRYPKDGFGSEASFDWIQAMATDSSGNLYICDSSAIRKITPLGLVTTVSGKLRVRDDWDTDGYVDGPGNSARFSYPDGIAVSSIGEIFVMDGNNNVIRKVLQDGTTSTFVGLKGASARFDGKGTKARLGNPRGLAIDSTDNLYFTDGPVVRKVYPDGTVRTIGGNRFASGFSEGIGEEARFGNKRQQGLAIDSRGTLYLAYERFIFEAESVVNPPSAPAFPTPAPLPTPVATPSPTPRPTPVSPQLLSLTLGTTTVDVMNGTVDLPFTANSTGTLRNINLSFSNNGSYGISGNTFSSNIYQPFLTGLISVREFSKPGLWTLSYLNIYDENYKSTSYQGSELAEFFKNLGIEPLSFTVTNSNPDTKPPVLHKLEFLTTEANTSNSSAKVRYRVEVSDDTSGFSHFYIVIRSANSWSSVQSNLSSSTWDSRIVSVSGNKTTYQGILEIPRGSPDGQWTVDFFSLNDQAGNSAFFSGSFLPAEIASLKISTGSGFTNPAEPEDKYHPWVVGFEIEPSAVDVSSSDQKVRVRVRVNNDDLPTSTSISASLRKLNQENNWRDELRSSAFRLVSGTVANGVYEAEFLVPKNYKSGNYTLDSLYVSESGNFNGHWNSKNWSRSGESIPAEFRKTLVVSGTADTTAPELKSVILSNSTLDTRNGTATFSANLQVTDDLIGLLETQNSWNSWEYGGTIGFTSPSGVGYVWHQLNRFNRISGTSSNGTYQVWFQLPQHSEEGTWTLDYIELRDRNYNTRFLIPANLVAAGIPVPTFDVLGHPRGWEQQTLKSTAPSKANATITLDNLVQTANGTEKKPSITTNPGNLTQNVTLTYNGTTTAPIDPGSYTVVAFLNHPAYQGRTVSTMTVNSPPPPQTGTSVPGSAPPSNTESPAVEKPRKKGGNKNKSSSASQSGGSDNPSSSVNQSSSSKKKSAAKKSGGKNKSDSQKSGSKEKSGGKKKKGGK